MTGSPLLLALWNLAILVTLGALVWLITWALFGDRGWRTPRCPRCWHDMSGATGMRCSECGTVIRNTKALHRHKRHWLIAAASLAALLVIALALRNAWSQRSWATMVPDRALLWLLPSFGTQGLGGEGFDELGDRLTRGRLSDSDVIRVLERCIAGDDTAPPGSIAWLGKYGRLLERWHHAGRRTFVGGGDDDPSAAARLALLAPVERALGALPPVLSIDVPPEWPSLEQLPVELLVQRSWAPLIAQRLVIDRVIIDHAFVSLLPPINGPITLSAREPLLIRVPLLCEGLPSGAHTGFAIVRVESEDATGTWSTQHSLQVPLAVSIGEPIPFESDGDDIANRRRFSPARGAELDAAMARMISPGLMRWERGERRFALRLDPRSESSDALKGIAIGATVEVLEDGIVRRRLRFWWPGRARIRFEPPQEDGAALARANAEDGRWTLRVRGDRDLSLRAALVDAPELFTGWWDGVIEIPLQVTEIPGDAPSRGWRIDPRPLDEPVPTDP